MASHVRVVPMPNPDESLVTHTSDGGCTRHPGTRCTAIEALWGGLLEHHLPDEREHPWVADLVRSVVGRLVVVVVRGALRTSDHMFSAFWSPPTGQRGTFHKKVSTHSVSSSGPSPIARRGRG